MAACYACSVYLAKLMSGEFNSWTSRQSVANLYDNCNVCLRQCKCGYDQDPTGPVCIAVRNTEPRWRALAVQYGINPLNGRNDLWSINNSIQQREKELSRVKFAYNSLKK